MTEVRVGLPLFDYYPHVPGHRGISSSIEAAEKIKSTVHTMRDRVHGIIKLAGANGITTEELCQFMKMEAKHTQPRVSELRKLGKVVDSGLRRKSESGVNVIVWKAI
jgi:hypothetical protein